MGSKSEKLRLLRQVSLFAPLSAKDLEKVSSVADELSVEAGRVLVAEGRPGKEFFVIAEGKAEVTLRGKSLAKFGAGDFFGEMSLIDPGPRSATVTATTPLRVYVLAGPGFISLLEDSPSLARSIMRGLVRRIRDLEEAPAYS